MKKPLTFSAWGRQLKKLFLLWLIAALAAGVIVVGGHYLTLPARSGSTAFVNFSFKGVEEGKDPNGNWFNPDDMRDEDVITAAAEAAGIPLEEDGAARIASALYIEGIIPDNVISRITSLSSVFSSDKVPVSSMRKIRAYYPTTYELRLDAAAAGLTPEQGGKLLEAVLTAYQQAFTTRYGYNPAFENAVLNEDYAAYEYEDAVALLEENLNTLGIFATNLASGDLSGFRSKETGLTLADVNAGIDALRQKDIVRLADYISSHNVTRDAELQKAALAWQVEEAGRTEAELRNRVQSLDALIAGYRKTKTLVLYPDASESAAPAAPDAAGQSDPAQAAGFAGMSAYETSRSSEVYDYLIRRRQKREEERQTAENTLQKLKIRQQNLESGVQEAANAYVDAEFSRILGQLRSLLASLRATAEEYDRSTRLEAGFTTIELKKAKAFPLQSLISASMADGIAVEALLFGLYLLLAAWRAGRGEKRARKTTPPAGEAA